MKEQREVTNTRAAPSTGSNRPNEKASPNSAGGRVRRRGQILAIAMGVTQFAQENRQQNLKAVDKVDTHARISSLELNFWGVL